MKIIIPHRLSLIIAATCLVLSIDSFAAQPGGDQSADIINAGFETGNLKGWGGWRTKRAKVVDDAHTGAKAVVLGPERGLCAQVVEIRPNSRYRLSAFVKTEAGAEEVQLIASDYGGAKMSVSSALTEYTEVSLEFVSARTAKDMLVILMHPSGPGKGYADTIHLEYLGEAPPLKVQSFIEPQERPILSEGGAAQKSDAEMDWYFDAKFGMFIHWGVYAAMDEGSEWVMHNKAYPPDEYRIRAENPVDGFTASEFDPADWAELAKTAGMQYMVLTARHHDGYALFDSQHPNSWTSVKHLGRDLIREYTDAVREAGIHVGLYYSPMSWRYPGYYDVWGNGCKPNVWGYETAEWHKENARVMKEEVYEQVTRLFSNYGPIEYMFWDGAWLGQSADAELEDLFWDTGLYQDPDTEWPIDESFKVRDEESGKAHGIMGLVRKFQPQLIVNERFSWIGDVHGEEGVSASAGPVRIQPTEKCMPLMKGGWGYRPNRPVFSFEEVVVYLSDCAVRNINLLLNVSPDKEGRIPENQRDVLVKVGNWLESVGEAIYETRGGPWQPLYGEYGFTYRDNRIFAHVFEGYQDRSLGTFTTQALGVHKVESVKNLQSGKELDWVRNKDNTITINDVDYGTSPALTVLQISLTQNVY
ncbi:alpha-fucosidase [Puniceicoccales bacterium CK1056]|uniref:alpha-L-fucosidase n=1 Tax=Oceanipulchritudo coccoides TaxID=2706888 RepID=A0A6B2M3N1_9BACT|nr:alpha-L-fucosidase [Oceanipulchritudo coccoides]NDV62912.1 alpha-fucosidase [Oceanipulchritudo coccoides]